MLLHFSVIYLLPYEKLRTELTPSDQQQPTIIRLVDKAVTQEKKTYELDQKPPQPVTEPPPERSRPAEADQRVEREQAPKGEDVRDQSPQLPSLPPTPTQVTPQQRSKKTVTTPTSKPRQRKDDGKSSEKAATVPQPPPEQPASTPPLLEQLTQLPEYTLSRMDRANKALRERIKQRDDVDTGDTVWLNLERGMLVSFFRRFRNQIEGVWNYPREAAENDIQGHLLLKITVDRDGELVDVDLLNSSGYDILDFEAIQAVYRAAPFGPLGKHYPHPDLKIMAHFRYMISGKYIYGRRR